MGTIRCSYIWLEALSLHHKFKQPALKPSCEFTEQKHVPPRYGIFIVQEETKCHRTTRKQEEDEACGTRRRNLHIQKLEQRSEN